MSCNSRKDENIEKGESTETSSIYTSKGYELMQQKCFICHFEKPDPSKKDAMLAPPMLRVQEHYKPSYPEKDEFINAIVSWVKNPSESETLMPGAIRKFNLMPVLPYEDADLKLIAEVIYNIDFGEMPRRGRGKNIGLQLNNGEKWRLSVESISQIDLISLQLDEFQSDSIAAYNQLGREVFDNAKMILLDDAYSDELFNQLHNFFSGIEGNMHLLIASNSLEEARKQQDLLKIKFEKFNNFFE